MSRSFLESLGSSQQTTASADVTPKVEKGHCPKCGPDRRAAIKGRHVDKWSDDEHPLWSIDEYKIMVCLGCETPYFQRSHVFSEDEYPVELPNGGHEWRIDPKLTYYPAPLKRARPKWEDEIGYRDTVLGDLLIDLYRCLDVDAHVPAAIAIRTVFDRSSELLGVDPASSFGEKLSELQNIGKISGDEKDALNVLTDAGSAAAHRAWRPSLSNLKTMTDVMENFIHRAFVLNDEITKLAAAIPAKPVRRNAPEGSPKQAPATNSHPS